jgi:hypothetical protein
LPPYTELPAKSKEVYAQSLIKKIGYIHHTPLFQPKDIDRFLTFLKKSVLVGYDKRKYRVLFRPDWVQAFQDEEYEATR